MKKALRNLRSRVGRDVERQLDGVAQQSRAALEELLTSASNMTLYVRRRN
ncbi:hypothetical protein [Burkholderia ubonensis]|nr:hypothetical protein [Burkholderia ubonensis]